MGSKLRPSVRPTDASSCQPAQTFAVRPQRLLSRSHTHTTRLASRMHCSHSLLFVADGGALSLSHTLSRTFLSFLTRKRASTRRTSKAQVRTRPHRHEHQAKNIHTRGRVTPRAISVYVQQTRKAHTTRQLNRAPARALRDRSAFSVSRLWRSPSSALSACVCVLCARVRAPMPRRFAAAVAATHRATTQTRTPNRNSAPITGSHSDESTSS